MPAIDLRSLADCFFGFLHQLGETGGIFKGNIRQDFAVQFDPGLLQPEDKLVVVDTVLTGRRSDPDDPEPPEVAFACLSVTIGELAGAVEGFGGEFEELALTEEITLDCFQNLLAALVPLGSSLDSWHYC